MTDAIPEPRGIDRTDRACETCGRPVAEGATCFHGDDEPAWMRAGACDVCGAAAGEVCRTKCPEAEARAGLPDSTAMVPSEAPPPHVLPTNVRDLEAAGRCVSCGEVGECRRGCAEHPDSRSIEQHEENPQ